MSFYSIQQIVDECMNSLGSFNLRQTGMHDGLEDIACLLTDTGDAGSSPHVAREVFSNDVP